MHNPATSFIYPTASTVTCYIDGVLMDQVYQIQYKETINRAPIYGYNDTYFSNIAEGRRLISGVLVVNFISPLYIEAIGNQKQLFIENLLDKKSNNLSNQELPTYSDKEARIGYLASLINDKNLSKQEIKDKLKESVLNKKNILNNSSQENPLLELYRQKSPMRTLQGNMNRFIDIYYGQFTEGIRFTNVIFTDVSQTISQAGAEGSSDPLYEIYSFIAREKQIISRT